MYFSEFRSVNDRILVHKSLTRSALSDLLCRDPKNRQDFCHDLNDHVRHFRSQRHLRVHLQTSEKHLYAPKDVQKSFMARTNVLSCLRTLYVTMTHANEWTIRTERRTPIPAKTTVAGENAYQINI
jgi:hypothetical protein